jgi:hypothetical protein
MRRKWIFLAPLAILAMLLFIFIGGEIVRLLWNWLLPPLFGWRQITFWQALGMLEATAAMAPSSAAAGPIAWPSAGRP